MADDPAVATAPSDYPWYRMVTSESLEQGELLLDVPFLVLASEHAELIRGEDPAVWIDLRNAVLLTQSCDLEAGKVDQVVMCPFFHIDDMRDGIKALRDKNAEKNVKAGRIESLYRLPPCLFDTVELDHQIVSFRQVFTMPFEVIEEHVRRQEMRVQLCPPYREHLAQAFARFFMRIGFPNDFDPTQDAPQGGRG